MVDIQIQSAMAENRRGIKKDREKEEESRRKPQDQNIMVCPII